VPEALKGEGKGELGSARHEVGQKVAPFLLLTLSGGDCPFPSPFGTCHTG